MGTGSSKKRAEQAAAEMAVDRLFPGRMNAGRESAEGWPLRFSCLHSGRRDAHGTKSYYSDVHSAYRLPHQCVFCDQHRISGADQPVTPEPR